MKWVESNEFNRQLYALTFGLQTIPPMAQKCLEKTMPLEYKQYKCSLNENSDMSLQIMMVGEQWQKVADIKASPLDKYITIDANNCEYRGTTE